MSSTIMRDPTTTADGEFAARARGLLGLLLLVYLLLASRLIHLQYLQHTAFLREEAKRVQARIEQRPWRGSIIDRTGKPLALSTPTRSCAVDPRALSPGRENEVLALLDARLHLSPVERQRLRASLAVRGSRFTWIRRHLPPAVSAALRRDLRARRLHCVLLPREYQRTYPMGDLAANIIGATDVDGRGISGMELIFDGFLRGRAATAFLERDARGRLLATPVQSLPMPERGLRMQLSLDSTIQAITEEELGKAVANYRGPATTGVALVMDPYNGDILAMADVHARPPRNEREARNRLHLAVGGVIEPGSTFKPFVLAAALETGKVKLSQKFFCEHGAWRMANGRLLRDAHGYGWLTAEDVLVKSSNIGIAKIGARLGARLLYSYARRFGFGARTGISMPGEIAGRLRPLSRWTSYSMGSIPMGQEISVSPLQLICAYAVIANGGLLVRPRLARAARSRTGSIDAPVRIRRRVISRRVAALLRQVLDQVVRRGTGRRARMPEYALGGKTGTSQLPVNAAERRAGERGYSHTRFVATFAALAPGKAPRIVILVSIREPDGAHYGGVVAAPAVREIARRSLLYLGVPPDNGR